MDHYVKFIGPPNVLHNLCTPWPRERLQTFPTLRFQWLKTSVASKDTFAELKDDIKGY